MWTRSPLKKKLKKALKSKNSPVFTGDDQMIIKQIDIRTREKNRNNVTRTQAYWDFYTKHPEIHWALLAHLVSRNAGWTMTDLKGEHMPHLLNDKERVDFFQFLERGNWLIFQDAYPQLLLYEKGKDQRRSLTHLLHAFGVSAFMTPVWDHYYQNGDSSFLTKALITNEQQYIESRVIQNQTYKKTVTDTVMFKLQDLLNLNHILIPYTTPSLKQRKLFGHTVHHFSSVDERIRFGKELYDLLYSVRSKLNQVVDWANHHPHTGSRKDYWPQLFNDIRERIPNESRTPREKPCGISENEKKFFSPPLSYAWGDQQQKPSEKGDWFKHLNQMHNLTSKIEKQSGDILPSYCDTIEKLEFAVFAKNALREKEDDSDHRKV